MKWLLILSIFPFSVFGQTAIPGGAATPETSATALQAVIESDTKIKGYVNQCYDLEANSQLPTDSTTGRTETVPNCIWRLIEAGGDKARVTRLIEQAQEAEAANRSDDSQIQLRNSVAGANLNNFINRSDPNGARSGQLKKLYELYSSKLDDAFKVEGDKINVTDQVAFFELAKTQLGKNVISAWSSVCIDAGRVVANGQQSYIIFDPTSDIGKAVRSANLAALNSGLNSEDMSDAYFGCARDLIFMCHQKKGKITVSNTNLTNNNSSSGADNSNTREVTIDYNFNASAIRDMPIASLITLAPDLPPAAANQPRPTTDTGQSIPDNDRGSEAILNTSKRRACEIVAYVDGIRRQLKATEILTDRLKNDNYTNTGSASRAWKFEENPDRMASPDQARVSAKTARTLGDIDVDKVTTVTSGELANGGFLENNESLMQLQEQCETNPNAANCAQLLANTQEEKDQLRLSGAAFILETKVVQEQLANRANLSEDEKRNLLLRLNPDIEDISAVDDIDAALSIAAGRFNAERDSLLDSISQQVRDLELRPNQDLASRSREQVANIISQGNQYLQLVHFNNVISGYFVVEGGQSNVRVLDLELGNMANIDTSTRSTTTGQYGYNSSLFGENYGQQLTENINRANEDTEFRAGTSPTTQLNNVVNLASDTIAQFFDYEPDSSPAATPPQPPVSAQPGNGTTP